MKDKISLPAARRIALATQGFADKRPQSVGPRHLGRVIDRIGLVQIDSVSAVVRAHYMPFYSRLGPYATTLLDQAAAGRKRRLFEYWAHEASYLPLETWPLMRWRMERAAQNREIYGGLAKWAQADRGFIDEILAEVAARGPLAASDIEGHKGTGGWWGWSEAKHAFEWLFWAGRLTVAARRGFERLYDLPERVLPGHIVGLPCPSPAESHRALLRVAARALGIATASDLRDYFRLSLADVRERIPELVEEGTLVPVAIEGWPQAAFLHRDARLPRRVEARALLTPFDPLVWERARAERLFGFRYRIEIYTPAHKREYGYYVLPFLLGDRLVGRVDLKADRPAGRLKVQGAFAEACAPPHTAEALREELELMRGWLGLEEIEIERRGNLAAELAQAPAKAASIHPDGPADERAAGGR